MSLVDQVAALAQRIAQEIKKRGLPPGGGAGQVLAKSGSDDYAADWITSSGSGAAAPSADTGNLLTLGSDSLLMLDPTTLPSGTPVNWRGAYGSDQTYLQGDVVYDSHSHLRVALKDAPGTPTALTVGEGARAWGYGAPGSMAVGDHRGAAPSGAVAWFALVGSPGLKAIRLLPSSSGPYEGVAVTLHYWDTVDLYQDQFEDALVSGSVPLEWKTPEWFTFVDAREYIFWVTVADDLDGFTNWLRCGANSPTVFDQALTAFTATSLAALDGADGIPGTAYALADDRAVAFTLMSIAAGDWADAFSLPPGYQDGDVLTYQEGVWAPWPGLPLSANNGDTVIYADGLWTAGAPTGGSGSGATRASVGVATASIANNASEGSDLALGTTVDVLRISADAACRVTVWVDATAEAADASRLITTAPDTSGGVFLDVYLDGSIPLVLVVPVRVAVFSAQPNRVRVTNWSGATAVLHVTFDVLVLEA